MYTDQAPAALTNDFLVTQKWEEYETEQHSVWSLLYSRRMESLRTTASRAWLEGAATIGLRLDVVPDLTLLNSRLEKRTGWNAVAVSGFIPAPEFFRMLSVRRFPTTITVRKRERLDYVPEPDIFHDVFGHVPLHAHPVFADFLQRFGALATRAKSDEATERMARLFWFTVEFGLIRENGEIKVYGSGLISSADDARNALGPDCDRRPFRLDDVLEQPFRIDELQEVLFIIDSWDQLFEALTAAGG
ncbi:MAG: phenylalanine 4-monooxygenase [Acidobacteriota bacterium]